MKLTNSLPKEVLKMAIDSIMGHKFRSGLTILGIVIGLITGIVVFSILNGMRQSIVSIIEEYGTNNIYAFHLSTGPRAGGEDRSERLRKPLKVSDAETIKRSAPAVEDVSMVHFTWGFDDNLTYQGRNYRWGNTQGVTSNYATIA